MGRRIFREVLEWVISLTAALIIVLVVKSLAFDIIEISGKSMIPALYDGDKVVVEKVSTYIGSVRRGEIVILDPGDKGTGIYIKRIVGLPGELLEVSGGKVLINGNAIEEKYLREGTYTDIDMKLTVPDDCVFVMGDNREISEDSRIIGPIPLKNLKGHAIFRIYPFERTRGL